MALDAIAHDGVADPLGDGDAEPRARVDIGGLRDKRAQEPSVVTSTVVTDGEKFSSLGDSMSGRKGMSLSRRHG